MPSWSPSILQRLTLALVVLTAIPLATVLYQIQAGRTAMVDQTQLAHLQTVRTAAVGVAAEVAWLGKLAAVAAVDRAVLDDPGGPEAAETLRDLVDGAGESIAAAGLFLLEDSRPELRLVSLARNPRYETEIDAALRPGDLAPLLAVRGAGVVWLRLWTEVPTELEPLAPGEPPPRLVLVVVALSEALDRAHFVLKELGDEADLVLSTRDGEVVAGTQDTLADFPAAMLAELAAAHANVGSGARHVGDDTDGDAAQDGAEGAAEFLTGSRGRTVAAFHLVDGTPWAVLSKQPTRLADRTAADLRRVALVLFAVVAALAALLLVYVRWSIVQPIRKIVAGQRKMAGAGDATVRGDEIVALEAAFAQLEENLYDREALSQIFLDRYQVRSVLGSGAMGTVFRGWDPRLKRQVALKTVKIQENALASEQERLSGHLAKEAVTLAQLQHPNIVTLYDLLEEGQAMFLAMELVEGKSLERYLWNLGRLPADQAILLAASLLRALEAAHARSLVHHDIKPANILLGKDGSIKLTDFGISQFVTAGQDETDKVFGTPGYLSPEALSGQGYGPTADLFAVGVVLYECLTGKAPFEGFGLNEIISNTLRCEVEPLSSKGIDLPPIFEEIVLSLLAKRPEDRPDNAAQAAAELDKLIAAGNMRWSPTLLDAEKDDDPDAISSTRLPSTHRSADFFPTLRIKR